MNKYKLSIITITYNNPDLKRTLDSILIQKNSYSVIEHIIVDNLSNDNTESIVNEYIREAPYKVTYIRERDNGIFNAMNKGINIAEGKYLSFMNGGDHFYDNNSIKNILNSNSQCDIIYGNLNVIDKENESIYYPPNSIDFKYFLSSALPHQASIIRKELFNKVGFYDDSLKIVSDWKFFLIAICKFRCSYFHLNKTISTYYYDGISSEPNNIKLVEMEKNKVFNENFSQINKKTINSFNKSYNEQIFKTPILFLIFNRPDLAQKVFNEIKKIKPGYLFVFADGHREEKEGEKEKCQETRKIIDQIDWNCELKILFRDKNFSCGYGASKAISWFFENVEEGIILEDDCLPDQTFFPYCEELLKKYRNDNRISHVNGTSFVSKDNTEDSYYFSKYYHVWGWATWRRAWNLYDFSMRNFKEFCSSNQIENIFPNKNIQKFWLSCFNKVFIDKIDAWDYQWVYTNFINNGLSIMPYINLIENIGFGRSATHTINANDRNVNHHTGQIKNIKHPLFIIINNKLDEVIYENHLGIYIGFRNIKLTNYLKMKSTLLRAIRFFIYRKLPLPIKKVYHFLRTKIIK